MCHIITSSHIFTILECQRTLKDHSSVYVHMFYLINNTLKIHFRKNILLTGFGTKTNQLADKQVLDVYAKPQITQQVLSRPFPFVIFVFL